MGGREKAYSEDIDDAENAGYDAPCNHDPPHWRSQALLGCGFFVEIAKEGDAQDKHHNAQRDEA